MDMVAAISLENFLDLVLKNKILKYYEESFPPDDKTNQTNWRFYYETFNLTLLTAEKVIVTDDGLIQIDLKTSSAFNQKKQLPERLVV